jgi:hypothetical protein
VLVIVLAGAAGLAAREFRAGGAPRDVLPEGGAAQAGPSSSPPAKTTFSPPPAPKWHTRRVPVPEGVDPRSMLISPDGRALAAPSSDKKRIVLYALDDPPGAIEAVLTKVGEAPYWSGYHFLPDGGLLFGRAPGWNSQRVEAKSVAIAVLEQDGSTKTLGAVWGGSVSLPAVSPDGAWLAFSEISTVQLIDRTGKAPARTVTSSSEGHLGPVGWSADGRLVIAQGQAVELISVDGTRSSIEGPSGLELNGVESQAPDGKVLIIRTLEGYHEGRIALAGDRWVELPQMLYGLIWMAGHEILDRSTDGVLSVFDTLAGRSRDLGFTMRGADAGIHGVSGPYVLWRESGRLHLLDSRSGYDVLVGAGDDIQGGRPYSGGGFLLIGSSGASLLTGDDWFARVPPTAGPFVSAAPLPAGAIDPFVDIAALPRIDQMTTGGSLTVTSRTISNKAVTSEEGGWSLEVPIDWRADVGRFRGGQLYSFDPTTRDYGGNAPSPDEVRITIELWPDLEQRGPAWFADHESGANIALSRERRTVTLGGAEAEVAITLESGAASGAPVTAARWYLRHPWFDDRVMGIQLWRADGELLRQAETVLATLRLSRPISGPRGPLIARADVIANTGRTTPGRVDRVEAKLVTVKEWWLAATGSRSYSLDMDTPIWIVVRWGDFEVQTRGIHGGTARFTWMISALDARTGKGFSGGGGSGAEPAWWAALRDRAQ